MNNEKVEQAKKMEYRNRPVILASAGTVTSWLATIQAVFAGKEIGKLIDEMKTEFDKCEPGDVEKKNQIRIKYAKKFALAAAPAVVFEVAATACMITSSEISRKRIATLGTAYLVADRALADHKDALRDVFGEKGEQKVREQQSRTSIETHMKSQPDSYIYATGHGSMLCFDELTGRRFWSSMDAINEAVFNISFQLQTEMWVNVNEFYDELDLPEVDLGDMLGWNVDDTYGGKIPVTYTAILLDGNIPCLSMHMDVSPRRRWTDD